MSAEPVITIEKVTPAIAAAWLQQNKHNRHLSPVRVSRLAGAMRRGEWALNGESFKFNGSGLMIDGQHRAAAVVESGVTIRSLVVRGLPASAQESLDLGAKRGIADMMALRGIPASNECATVVGYVHRWEQGIPSAATGYLRSVPSDISMTPPVAFGVWARHGSGILEAVRRAQARKDAMRPLGVTRTLWAFLDYLLGAIDAEDRTAFLGAVLEGAGLAATDPRYLLRERLLHNAAARDRMPKAYQLALILKAWNLWRLGERRTTLVLKATEEFPVPDGAAGWTDWAANRAARKAAA